MRCSPMFPFAENLDQISLCVLQQGSRQSDFRFRVRDTRLTRGASLSVHSIHLRRRPCT